MKIKIDYEEYDRYESKYSSIIIKGSTLRSCLLQAYDSLGLYEEAEDVIEDEKENIGHKLTDKELLDRMIEQSEEGGCDYILSITNVDTGESIYNSSPTEAVEEVESSWDDEGMHESLDEEEKEETFEDKLDFLADDEEEAIEGYDKVIDTIDNEHVKDNLEHIRDEEVAHKEYLDAAKEDPDVDYEHEEKGEEMENVEVKEPLEEGKLDEMAKLPYGVLAWKLGEIMMAMNNEDAYYGGWLYIWPDGETKEDCMEDFNDAESYNELRQSFEKYYKAYHDDGLYTENQDIVDYAHKIDAKLGLEPIENHGKTLSGPEKGDDPYDESLEEALSEDKIKEFKKHEFFKDLNDLMIKNLIKIYLHFDFKAKEDTVTPEQVYNFMTEEGLGVFLLDNFDKLKFINFKKLGLKDPKLIKLCRDYLGPIFDEYDMDDEEVLDFTFSDLHPEELRQLLVELKRKYLKESLHESIIVPLNNEQDIKEAKEELEDDEEDPVLEVVDLDANVESELDPQASYAGDYTLKCTKCGDLRVVKADDLVKDEETGYYNIEDTCAHCNTADGWELIGQLASTAEPEVKQEPVEETTVETEDEFTDEDEAELPEEDTTDYTVEPLADDIIEDEEIVEESFKKAVLNHLTETFDNVTDYEISNVSYDEEANKIILEGIISYTSGNKVNSNFELNVSRKDNNIILEGNNNVLSKDEKAFTFLCESVDKKLTNKSLEFNYNYKGNEVKGKING